MQVEFITDDNVSVDLYNDYGFICDFPMDMNAPNVRTNYVTIPGRNGELDLSEIDGYLYYEDIEFTIVAQKICRNSQQIFNAVRTFINQFNGQRIKIRLNNEQYCYDARVQIEDYQANGLALNMAIKVKAFPFRLQTTPTIVTETITGSAKTITLINGTMQVVPTITTSAAMSISYENVTYNIGAGTNIIIPNLVLKQGNNELEVTGTGTITFTYTQGEF